MIHQAHSLASGVTDFSVKSFLGLRGLAGWVHVSHGKAKLTDPPLQRVEFSILWLWQSPRRECMGLKAGPFTGVGFSPQEHSTTPYNLDVGGVTLFPGPRPRASIRAERCQYVNQLQ